MKRKPTHPTGRTPFYAVIPNWLLRRIKSVARKDKIAEWEALARIVKR